MFKLLKKNKNESLQLKEVFDESYNIILELKKINGELIDIIILLRIISDLQEMKNNNISSHTVKFIDESIEKLKKDIDSKLNEDEEYYEKIN